MSPSTPGAVPMNDCAPTQPYPMPSTRPTMTAAAVLVVALTFIVINIVTDLVYGLLDPRVSVQ